MKNSERYDFDTPVERRGTASLKWEKYGSRDIIPMWVADMDFQSPPEVLKAIVNRAAHGVFGYTLPPEKLNNRIVSMLEETYDWVVDPEWLVWLPSLVTGLNVACRAVGQEGDVARPCILQGGNTGYDPIGIALEGRANGRRQFSQ